MKQIFTLLTSLLFLSSAFAYSTRLTISSSNDKDNIRVQVDGRNYQVSRNAQDGDFVIDDLRAGYHSIKVYKLSNTRKGWGSQNNTNNLKLIYNGNVYVKNGFHTDISINRFGKAFVDEQQIQRYDDDDNNYDNYEGNWNRQPMNERNFEQLKQTIRRESFDDSKLSIAKTAVRDQAVSTTQVRELLSLFSFEQNKLDLAKYCYSYTTDHTNYYQVANSFGYSSSKQELMRYIEQNKRQ
ncbi:MAG: DUF4476 domain-containing protein [Chitinophagaceae bacterium]|nr:MAG: DUF4476 domain-containing protein [Chitinophagaceae bacterium]